MIRIGRTYNTYQLVAQELWQRKQTSLTLGLRPRDRFVYCHNPGHPVDNYYIFIWLSTLCQFSLLFYLMLSLRMAYLIVQLRINEGSFILDYTEYSSMTS
jgi:hypothetical protein